MKTPLQPHTDVTRDALGEPSGGQVIQGGSMSTFSPFTVAFVCTHNACRSQIAQALAQSMAANELDVFSAGTHPAAAVNPDAARLLEQRYGLDTAALFPKSLEEIPPVDMVVTMGCGVACPDLKARWREDWGLEDPTGKPDADFVAVMGQIETRIEDLKRRVIAGAFDENRLAANLKTLGDPNRLRIVGMLSRSDELCACKLLEALDISQPTLSHHMAALRDMGLVLARKDGRWTRYSLDKRLLSAIGACLGE